MSRTVTVTLPDALYARIEQQARGTRRPIEVLVVDTLSAALRDVGDAPPSEIADLRALEAMDAATLRGIVVAPVDEAVRAEIEALLDKRRAGPLTEDEGARLQGLQRQVDGIALRRARAAALLRLRGERLPVVSDLHVLSERLMAEARFLGDLAMGEAADQAGWMVAHDDAKRRIAAAISGG